MKQHKPKGVSLYSRLTVVESEEREPRLRTFHLSRDEIEILGTQVMIREDEEIMRQLRRPIVRGRRIDL